jgi:SAM-dependent methyltransferase
MINLEEKLSIERLIDLSLLVGMVPDAKFHFKWHEYAQWQLNMLKEIGLKSNHKLLDIGCGPLRFGMEAINFLETDCYCGMDPYKPYIDLGQILASEVDMGKAFRVIEDKNFGFNKFEEKFDFAISQSVFTHLSRNQVELAICNCKEVMKDGGVLLFTNIESGFPRGFLYGSRHPMFTGIKMDRDFYEGICKNLEIQLVYNALKHPTQGAHLIKF